MNAFGNTYINAFGAWHTCKQNPWTKWNTTDKLFTNFHALTLVLSQPNKTSEKVLPNFIFQIKIFTTSDNFWPKFFVIPWIFRMTFSASSVISNFRYDGVQERTPQSTCVTSDATLFLEALRTDQWIVHFSQVSHCSFDLHHRFRLRSCLHLNVQQTLTHNSSQISTRSRWCFRNQTRHLRKCFQFLNFS